MTKPKLFLKDKTWTTQRNFGLPILQNILTTLVKEENVVNFLPKNRKDISRESETQMTNYKYTTKMV